MKHIGLIPFEFDPQPILAELNAHPELWDQIPFRTISATSPHREVSDIWVRYNSFDHFEGNMEEFNSKHESVWYPCIKKLPSVKKVCEDLFDSLKGSILAGILITKVPAHKQVYPHIDRGWHAESYKKVGLQLAGNDKQAFCFKGESLSANPGQAYFFDNQVPHWVINNSDQDRITLIVTGLWEEVCR